MSATIQGLYTALVTPFAESGIDEKCFADLIEWQVGEGVHGVVPCGTTGESPTLKPEEHHRLIEIAVEATAGRIPVMAGTGSNSTDEAIDFTRHAEKAGASSALIVAPYYNKPTQEGLYRHFRAIHDACGLPIIVYNIPGRSVVSLTDDTLCRLAELPRIAGVKDATGDLARVSTLRHRLGDRLIQLSGEDMTTIGFNALGGKGCISVTANIDPKRCAEIQNLTLAGNYAAALELHQPMVPLHEAMFCEVNPVPVKFALAEMGRIPARIRLPLTEPTPATQDRVRAALGQAGLL